MTIASNRMRYAAAVSAAALATYALTCLLRKTRSQKQEDKIDETVEDSFPASDPPPF